MQAVPVVCYTAIYQANGQQEKYHNGEHQRPASTPKWGDSFDKLSNARKQELRERLETWKPEQATKEKRGPFAGEYLNGLEVFWLAACTMAGKNGEPFEAAQDIPYPDPFARPRITLPTSLMAELNLRAANMRSASLRNAYLSGADLRKVDLREADLSEACLNRADLRKANLSQARLFNADLSRALINVADLSHTILAYANLSKAQLKGSYLIEADLFDANLSESRLDRARLSGARLHYTNLSKANANRAYLSGANLSGANLSGANLSEAQFVKTNLSQANLMDCNVYGIAAWDVQLDGATQTNLRISSRDVVEITVDNLEMAQFLYLMLHNDKIRQVIDTITSKVVLILGRFTKPRKLVLDALRDALRKSGYVPVLFDFDGPNSKTTTETVTLLARMARFVIADLTEPSSVGWELREIVPGANVPVQTLLLDGAPTFSMASDLWRLSTHLMLPLYRYTTIDELLTALNEHVIAPAEARAAELQRQRMLPVDGLS